MTTILICECRQLLMIKHRRTNQQERKPAWRNLAGYDVVLFSTVAATNWAASLYFIAWLLLVSAFVFWLQLNLRLRFIWA